MAVLIKELLENYHIMDVDTKLDIDMAIRDLVSRNKFSREDSSIIDLIKLQYSIPEVAFKLNKSERTVYRQRKKICHSIAERLGTSYQDIKIVFQVRDRLGRELSEEECLFCWDVICGYNRRDKSANIFNFQLRMGNDTNESRRYQTQRQMDMQTM